MPRWHLRPRSSMPASTTEAPLPNRCIPVAAFSKSINAPGIVPPTPKLNVFMRHLQRKQTPLATFGRFRSPNRPETPQSVGVFPGRRSRQRTIPAENRTEVQNPWQNRHPFPAKPPRSRGNATAGKAAAAVNVNAGATRSIAGARPQAKARQPPTPTRAQPTLAQRPTSQRTHLRPLFENASSDNNARDNLAVPRPTALTLSRFKLPRYRCIEEAAATDEHAGMLIGPICARTQTNACTGCTANHRAKALMENASRAPYPPLQTAAPSRPR